jgi:adenine-specific DNA-methyltransferase
MREPCSVSEQKALGQFFTPRQVADLMVSMLRSPASARTLEPSAGAGVFIDALQAAGRKDIEAWELDERVIAERHRPLVHVGSFVGASVEGEFGAVIGNPPYVRWKNMTAHQREELASDPLWAARYNSLCDLLLYFVSRSAELLETGGELVFITPDFWLGTKHASALRAHLLQLGALTDIVRFGEARVFPGVASSILIFRFERGLAPGEVTVRDYTGPAGRVLEGAGPEPLDDPEWFHTFHDQHPDGIESWTFMPAEDAERLDRLERACRGIRLGQIARIANGMVSGLDRAFRLDDATWEQLDETERALTIPVLKGRDAGSVLAGPVTRYVMADQVASEAELARLPHLDAHLGAWRERLERRYDYGRQWWQWSFPRSRTLFDQPAQTIMVPCKERITSRERLRFCVADPGIYPTQDVSAIRLHESVRESPAWIAAVLSSSAWFDWVSARGLMKGGVAEFSERPLSQLPVLLIDWSDDEDVAAHDEVVHMAEQGEVSMGHVDALIERMLRRRTS